MSPHFKAPFAHADKALEAVGTVIEPVRRSLFRRFPVVAILAVTFGVGATFFGIERVFATIPLFNDHPWFTLALGFCVLAITGKLYAKLG
jgi:uncharacterized integral membrane protein